MEPGSTSVKTGHVVLVAVLVAIAVLVVVFVAMPVVVAIVVAVPMELEVITSNSDLDSLDPRIRSRLCDPDLCRHVFISCEDYRMRRMDPRFAGGQGSGGRSQGQRGFQGQRRQSRG